MTANNPPEITLELSGGTLTIRTQEAVYRIVVPDLAEFPPALPGGPAPTALPGGEAAHFNDWEEPGAFQDGPQAGFHEPPPPAPKPARQETAPLAPPDAGLGAVCDPYYQELSNDMFREVGKLARRLSLSMRDVKLVNVERMDLQTAGDQLEAAKGQLESVVEMTEKATMRIIDLSENIQKSCDEAKVVMRRMVEEAPTETEASGNNDAALLAQAFLNEAVSAVNEYLGRMNTEPLMPLLESAEGLLNDLMDAQEQAAAPPAPEPEPEPEPGPEPEPQPAGPSLKWSFPLDLVFQTMYELCTNETVKKHIKAMWDGGEKAFDAAKLEELLNELATEPPDVDNFLNLDLAGVLKSCFQATREERYKNVFKKMAGQVSALFLDSFLPLEAAPHPNPGPAAAPAPAAKPKPKPQKAAPAPPPPPAAPPLDPELITRFQELVEGMRNASNELLPPELGPGLENLVGAALSGLNQPAPVECGPPDQDRVSELEGKLQEIFASVNAIVEASAFQDLSGQTIQRIVRLLTDFQVQLLAMVVSFGSKLKSKESQEGLTTDQSEKLAQEEVDRVLEGLGISEDDRREGEPAAGRLDQDAINNLLEHMGF